MVKAYILSKREEMESEEALNNLEKERNITGPEDIQNNNGNDNINTPTAESDIADDEVMVSDDDIV